MTIMLVATELVARVSKVALAPGFAGFSRHLLALRRDDAQVLVIGEAHEWETVEYVADAFSAGMDLWGLAY